VQIRYPFILGLLLWGVIWSGVLANGNVSDGVKMTSYLALNLTAANTNLYVFSLSLARSFLHTSSRHLTLQVHRMAQRAMQALCRGTRNRHLIIRHVLLRHRCGSPARHLARIQGTLLANRL
jgi:hypothetical protein